MIPIWRQLRFRASRTRLRNLILWYRHRGLVSNDVFIGSFPRSGTYWLRFQLFEILTGRSPHFGFINQSLPWIGKQKRALPVLPESGRLISTHEQYRLEYGRGIYLVRDVRDVVLSAYAAEEGMGLFGYPGRNGLESYLVPFLTGAAIPFGSWQEHVRSWLESPLAADGNLLVIRYEDMQEDTAGTLARVVTFLGVSAQPARIRQAVENNALDKMRAKEDKSKILPRASHEEVRFVRQGRVGGWRHKLSEEQLELVDRYAGKVIALLGYPDAHAPDSGVFSDDHANKPVAG